jgi:hypothetical protein
MRLDGNGAHDEAGIDLYWLPLGAGGRCVRLNGRVFEAVQSRLERRRPLDLYHSALEVRVPEGCFVVEMTPIPDGDGASRGVVGEGPVGSRRAARFRVFRYELRCWRDGVILDADEAVASPKRLSNDLHQARRLLNLVGSVPTPVWGRDELKAGEMWNSNSVVSWLLARSGLPTERIRPPAGGRAPGWSAGLITARRKWRGEEARFAARSNGSDGTRTRDLRRDSWAARLAVDRRWSPLTAFAALLRCSCRRQLPLVATAAFQKRSTRYAPAEPIALPFAWRLRRGVRSRRRALRGG